MAASEFALVTGGAGFLGRHLVDRLLTDGWRVRTLDVKAARAPDAESVIGDVSDPSVVDKACQDVDVVFHLAALLPQRRRPVAEMRAVNVGGARNVFEAVSASDDGPRSVVVLSSVEVYGMPQTIPCPEDAATQPLGEYGRNKVEVEALARDAAAAGIHAPILRPCTIVGPGMPEPLLSGLVAAARKGRPVFVVGRGRQRIQLVSVFDVVEACLCALEVPEASGDVFNLGSADVPTMRETAGRALAALESRSRIVSLPAWFVVGAVKALALIGKAPLEPEHLPIALTDYVFSIEKAQRVLGWNPAFDNARALLERPPAR